ncbi:TRAP transporter substrate-binding protein DctP, partial [Chloroflexota bacterium]
ADIAHGFCGLSPGRFPLSECVGVSPTGVHTKVGHVLWELYQEFPEFQAEYSDVKVLWFYTATPYLYITTIKDKPVRSLADFKGLKLSVGSPTVAARVMALGGSAEVQPPGDVYLSLQNKVIDGTLCPYSVQMSRRWAEFCTNIAEVSFGNMPFFVVMNLDTFNSLPPDVQQVIEELSGDYAVDLTEKATQASEIKSKDRYINEYGGQINQFTPEEIAKLEEIIKPVTDKYIADLEAKGLPGKKFVDEMYRLWDQYKY